MPRFVGGMPTDPKKNRLAMKVEDHDLSHLDYEDLTPIEGKAGAVRKSIWDAGPYEAEKFGEGEVIFTLPGERLAGRYAIFRTADKNWLVHRMVP